MLAVFNKQHTKLCFTRLPHFGIDIQKRNASVPPAITHWKKVLTFIERLCRSNKDKYCILNILIKMRLRKIFGSKWEWERIRRGWGKLQNEGLGNIYSSLYIIRVMKWSRMTWTRHVARTERRQMHSKFYSKILNGRHHIGDLGADW